MIWWFYRRLKDYKLLGDLDGVALFVVGGQELVDEALAGRAVTRDRHLNGRDAPRATVHWHRVILGADLAAVTKAGGRNITNPCACYPRSRRGQGCMSACNQKPKEKGDTMTTTNNT